MWFSSSCNFCVNVILPCVWQLPPTLHRWSQKNEFYTRVCDVISDRTTKVPSFSPNTCLLSQSCNTSPLFFFLIACGESQTLSGNMSLSESISGKVFSRTWKEAGSLTCTADMWGVIEMFWTHFWGALMSSIFIYGQRAALRGLLQLFLAGWDVRRAQYRCKCHSDQSNGCWDISALTNGLSDRFNDGREDVHLYLIHTEGP